MEKKALTVEELKDIASGKLPVYLKNRHLLIEAGILTEAKMTFEQARDLGIDVIKDGQIISKPIAI